MVEIGNAIMEQYILQLKVSFDWTSHDQKQPTKVLRFERIVSLLSKCTIELTHSTKSMLDS